MVAYARRVIGLVAVAGLATVAAANSPAAASWSADVSRDANGRVKVQLTADVDGGRTIYATCDTSRNSILAVLVPASDPALSLNGMTLSFAFADGRRWTSRAALYRYDNDLVAVGYGTPGDVPSIVAAFAGAKDTVEVEVEAPATGHQIWTADARGSTAAARKFLDNCFPTN